MMFAFGYTGKEDGESYVAIIVSMDDSIKNLAYHPHHLRIAPRA